MRSKIWKKAEKDAQRLVGLSRRTGFAVEPVGIAKGLGVKVLECNFDQETLGALFMKPLADPEICVNRGHGFFRRRVSCALEMGYYVHMSAKTNEYERVDLHDGSEQRGGEADDAYARELAACLLMPEEDIKILDDLRMDDFEMALRFRVPREVTQKRLVDLGMATFEYEAA